MKKFIFAVVLLACVIAGGIWYQHTVSAFATEVAGFCDGIERLAFKGEQQALERELERFERYWAKKGIHMSYFIDHVHLNDLSKSIGELGAAVRSHETTEVLLTSARVRIEAQTIAKDELFLPENIF